MISNWQAQRILHDAQQFRKNSGWGAALGITFLGVFLSASVHAAIFTVNSPSDVVGAAPLNDGICATAYNNGVPNGVCTLRAAVMEANYAPGGPHTIILSPNTYTLTILPAGANDETTGDLNITANMNIVGESAFTTIIDGNGSVTRDRVFSISLFIAVNISGVTIRNGAAPTEGGGILALGPLTLTNSRVINNSAAGGQGGGILNDGSRGFLEPLLTLINSAVSENIARDFGGGISVIVADMVLINSTVSGNAAVGGALFVDDGSGGGIATFNSNVTLVNSTVSGNKCRETTMATVRPTTPCTATGPGLFFVLLTEG